MIVEPIIFIILVSSTLVLLILVAIVTGHYVKLAEKLKKLSSKEEHQVDRLEELAQNEEAKEKELLKKQQILTGEKSEIEKELTEEIRKVANLHLSQIKDATDIFAKSFATELENIRKQQIDTLSNISKNLVNASDAEVETFKEQLAKETIESEKQVEEKTKKAYEAMLVELDKHKQDKLERIDQEIYHIIEIVCKETIGKSLSLEEHKELILDSLNRAKKDGFI